MFRAWGAPLSRPTKDIDLLGYTSNAVENLLAIILEICVEPVEADGIIFDRGGAGTLFRQIRYCTHYYAD